MGPFRPLENQGGTAGPMCNPSLIGAGFSIRVELLHRRRDRNGSADGSLERKER